MSNQRYHVVQAKGLNGYAHVVDITLGEPCATWPIEMAGMLQMIYLNLLKQFGPTCANEFMYGAILSHNLTLVHADKLPKIETTRSEDGLSVHMKVTMPDGSVVEHDKNLAEGAGAMMQEVLQKAGPQGRDAPKDPPPTTH